MSEFMLELCNICLIKCSCSFSQTSLTVTLTSVRLCCYRSWTVWTFYYKRFLFIFVYPKCGLAYSDYADDWVRQKNYWTLKDRTTERERRPFLNGVVIV